MRKHGRVTSLLAIGCMILFLVAPTTPAYGFALDIRQCNSNGMYQANYTLRTCVDPASGLLVGYRLYSGFTWKSNDGVVHSFPLLTLWNSSEGYGADGSTLCGPDNVETGSATASDGSGYTIYVFGFDQAQIVDRNGVEVFISPGINFGDPNSGNNC